MFDRSYISNTGSTAVLPAERRGRPVHAVPVHTSAVHTPAPVHQRTQTKGRDMTALSAPAPRLRITPRGRAVVAVLVAIPIAIGAVAVGLGQGAAATPADAPVASSGSSFHWITVGHGDSLWSIAQRIAPGSDPRDVVADIVDLNQLPSASVAAGERIAIPARYGH